ncbi:TusE/DsrC/DsvC family sulfur relay protein [Faucicola mancuniensis]|uniref:TusE/DsrC/DsvC family sulfur relay protein n=1 Tax=Faucicola mancuniensis TaxID=1309795 RepID=UPI0028E688CF|nr:TusE/DsrC/DsvC family sulfur relay protein [uncultured Moraxella sp.]
MNIELDADGHLLNHTDWTTDIAQTLADTLDVQLTEEHFAILQAVRDYYANFSHPPTTRPLIKYLSQTLPQYQIDNAKLQSLFNTGLVARHVNRIAGLPKPANCL